MKARLAILIVLPAVAAGGCANLMTVQQQAPVWFEQAQREIAGEGYPDLCEVPVVQSAPFDEAQWERDAAGLRVSEAQLQRAVDALGPIPTDEELRARAAQERAAAGFEDQ